MANSFEAGRMTGYLSGYAAGMKSKWIPSNGVRPRLGDYVLTSVNDPLAECKRVVIEEYGAEEYWDNGIVEAWMPLPDVYVGQQK